MSSTDAAAPANPSAPGKPSAPPAASDPEPTPQPSPSSPPPPPTPSNSNTPTPTPTPTPSTPSTPDPPPKPSTTSTPRPPPPPPSTTSTPTPRPSTPPPPPVVTPTVTITQKTTVSTPGGEPTVVTNVITKTQTPDPVPTNNAPVLPPISPTDSASNPTDTSGAGIGGPSDGNGGDGGGGGLQGGGKIAVAVAIPIVGVALIAMAVLFFWKRHRKNKQSVAERRKEVEEYGYNPNKDAMGGAGGVGTDSPGVSDEPYEMQDNHTDGGYRGWGSTAARRYTNTAPSTGVGSLSPVVGGYMYEKEAYGNPGQHSPNGQYVGGLAPSDHNSDTPMNRDSYRPSTAESTTMGGEMGPLGVVNGGHDNGQAGLNRGISNASSNYSAFHSDHSNELHYATYGNTMDDYDYAGNRKSIHSPVIQTVEARRHTRIETPTNMHYPQQGNSGIAQNF
ncbi:hypothetical protein BJ508DRAFT_95050 [Ascobolus immersus RN42]|uniref:Mid2 domain-containing protein n=1 Tax=Ascobolus immersus RN42 TaxID=1160509 RepID=A0A3N4ILL6_ASCIM|nr:hypothetical protein BJ508DRAFT_95050 [Ascobolus immersus RN42]